MPPLPWTPDLLSVKHAQASLRRHALIANLRSEAATTLEISREQSGLSAHSACAATMFSEIRLGQQTRSGLVEGDFSAPVCRLGGPSAGVWTMAFLTRCKRAAESGQAEIRRKVEATASWTSTSTSHILPLRLPQNHTRVRILIAEMLAHPSQLSRGRLVGPARFPGLGSDRDTGTRP